MTALTSILTVRRSSPKELPAAWRIMVFNSKVFLFLFFPLVFGSFWLSKTKRQRYAVLAISGYVFYGYWDWRYCFLLAFSSLVSFFSALRIQGTDRPAGRRFWLIASISVDLT